jgi:Spy/CpxP family protein refolding chaperone
MRHALIRDTAVAALAAGIVFAQAPARNMPRGDTNAQEKPNDFMVRHLEHLAQVLNLTDSQKEQARTLFEQTRQAAQPIRQELRLNRAKLAAAAKDGTSEADIQELANKQGHLLGRLVAIHTVAASKFYQMLTPEQRVKADQMHEEFGPRAPLRERRNGP